MRVPPSQSLLVVVAAAAAPLHRGVAQTQPVHETPITISSPRQANFVSTAYLRGRIVQTADSLVATLDTVLIEQRRSSTGWGVMHIDSIRVGLATTTAGQWDMYRSAPTIRVADSLALRTAFTLPARRLVLHRPPDSLLARSWLVVAIYQVSAGESAMPGTITTYAHSARDLFASWARE